MEFCVMHEGKEIGVCQVEELGLYWSLTCRCRLLSDKIERLYWKDIRLGVLDRDGSSLYLSRRISKSGLPGFPGAETALYLRPPIQVLDCLLPPTRQKDGRLWYPFRQDRPFPCMPLACFFSLERENGAYYWTISRDLACSTL